MRERRPDSICQQSWVHFFRRRCHRVRWLLGSQRQSGEELGSRVRSHVMERDCRVANEEGQRDVERHAGFLVKLSNSGTAEACFQVCPQVHIFWVKIEEICSVLGFRKAKIRTSFLFQTCRRKWRMRSWRSFIPSSVNSSAPESSLTKTGSRIGLRWVFWQGKSNFSFNIDRVINYDSIFRHMQKWSSDWNWRFGNKQEEDQRCYEQPASEEDWHCPRRPTCSKNFGKTNRPVRIWRESLL